MKMMRKRGEPAKIQRLFLKLQEYGELTLAQIKKLQEVDYTREQFGLTKFALLKEISDDFSLDEIKDEKGHLRYKSPKYLTLEFHGMRFALFNQIYKENIDKFENWVRVEFEQSEYISEYLNSLVEEPIESTIIDYTEQSDIPTPPFTILAGISGTGKSRFVKTQALLSNGLPEDSTTKIDNYSLISVRPDWHEPSDILGYVSRIDNKFHSTEFIEFLMKAWDEVFKFYDDIHLQDKNQAEGEPRPFWLCLDEMNLAPVEQFFADFLSVYESRKWSQGYFCEPLIKENVQLIKESIWTEMSDEFWTKFEDFGAIPIPPNLMVVGTVNMDETTHGFSRKVLDRAFSVDFAEFFPNDFDSFFGVSNSSMKALSYPTMTHLFQIDENGSKKYFGSKFDPTNLSVLSAAKDFLKSLNDQTLKSTPFEVGYRALDQLLLMVEYWYEGNKESLSDDNDKKWLASILDEFVMTKILPRVEGDIDKLGVKDQNSDTNILQVLKDFLNEHEIFKSITSEDSSRFDLFREKGDDPMKISCRSIVKIDWMISRLEKSGYSSFWI